MSDPAGLATPLAVHFVVALAVLYPLIRIFRRAGLPAWPALGILVPVIGFALVGSYLAFRPWPAIRPRRPAKTGAI